MILASIAYPKFWVESTGHGTHEGRIADMKPRDPYLAGMRNYLARRNIEISLS